MTRGRPGCMSKAVWPEARVKQMLALNAQGQPPRVIYKLLNADESLPPVSRSAVISKLRRLGGVVMGPEKPRKPKPSGKMQRNRSNEYVAREPDKPHKEKGAQRSDTNVRFSDREPNQCARFVCGEEGANGLVCGARTSDGSHWCPDCSRAIFQPAQKEKAA